MGAHIPLCAALGSLATFLSYFSSKCFECHVFYLLPDICSMQSAAKQSREDARVAWEQAKLRTAALATRADVTANLHAMQQAGARESIEQLSLAARERYEGLSAERNKANARLDLANQLKRKQRHALNTEMIEDVVASLVFMATATVRSK